MQLRRQIKNLGKNALNKCTWAVKAFHKLLSYTSVSNLIAVVALLIAYNSLRVSNRSLDTSLSMDAFVNKTKNEA